MEVPGIDILPLQEARSLSAAGQPARLLIENNMAALTGLDRTFLTRSRRGALHQMVLIRSSRLHPVAHFTPGLPDVFDDQAGWVCVDVAEPAGRRCWRSGPCSGPTGAATSGWTRRCSSPGTPHPAPPRSPAETSTRSGPGAPATRRSSSRTGCPAAVQAAAQGPPARRPARRAAGLGPAGADRARRGRVHQRRLRRRGRHRHGQCRRRLRPGRPHRPHRGQPPAGPRASSPHLPGPHLPKTAIGPATTGWYPSARTSARARHAPPATQPPWRPGSGLDGSKRGQPGGAGSPSGRKARPSRDGRAFRRSPANP
jgi:hypothetical protein